MSDWFRVAGDGRITLTLQIQPGAKTTEFAGLHGDALKVRLAAPPVDGKANDALLRFLAEALGIPKSAVRLKSGKTSRRKIAEIVDATPSAIESLCPPKSRWDNPQARPT